MSKTKTPPDSGSWQILTEDGKANLRKYQYRGGDKSISYKYFLSPFAEKCLVFVPKWMAPNLITLIGLSCSFASYLLVTVLAPNFDATLSPRWMFPIISLGLFMYQNLDNMDGKQARRTGSSSPLGLLFDHGCDALNCTVGGFFFVTVMSPGMSLPLVTMCFANQAVPFFFHTWEEYYTHEMVLPIVNGPSEGVLIGVLMGLATYFVGPMFWWEESPLFFGQMPAKIIFGGSFVGIVGTVLGQCVNVASHQAEKRQSLVGPVLDMLPHLYLWVFGGSWLSNNPHLFQQHPQAVVFLFGLLHMEMVLSLMVCHICGMKFYPWRLILLPLGLLWANSALLEKPVVDDSQALLVYLGVTVFYLSVYVVKIVLEVRDALGIYCFSLKKRKNM